MFIWRKKASVGWAERDRQTERQKIPSKLYAVSAEPNSGLDPMNCEVMT